MPDDHKREADASLAIGFRKVEDPSRHPIEQALTLFLESMDDFRDAFRLGMPALSEKRKQQQKKGRERLDALPIRPVRVDGEDSPALEADHPQVMSEMMATMDEMVRLSTSRILEVAARSLFIGIFTEFDVFMGRLLTALYSSRPELLKGIKREISLAELLEFSDLAGVKRDLMEKEIDSFRRDSYIEQFASLEQKFELRTLRQFKEWSEFVELSQRRNLMTHNGGRVNDQYLLLCQAQGCRFDPCPKIGEELRITPDYAYRAIFVMKKTGFMLAHTLWRKVFPDQQAAANESLNDALFALLKRRHWKLASEVGQFALTPIQTKEITDKQHRVRLVNTAIALKMRGGDSAKQAIALLETVDWSASLRDFRLATAVLNDNIQEATDLMRDIGQKGEMVNQLAYHTWPLFEQFRDKPEFHAAYREIYGEDFLSAPSGNEPGDKSWLELYIELTKEPEERNPESKQMEQEATKPSMQEETAPKDPS